MASVADKLPEQSPTVPVRSIPWNAIVWFTALLIAGNFIILKSLVAQWWNDGDMNHGFLVPIAAGYIAWQGRNELLALEYRPAWWGIAIMLWGAVQGYLGWLSAELFLQRTSVLILLLGLLLVLGGTALVRALLFPLVLLPFMIPIPEIIYNRITFPLQLFASSVAETVLGWLNIPVLREGNILVLAHQSLSVAEACSGIRSLLSLIFVSLVYAYLYDKRVWMRWALVIAIVPIAILANAGRVTITGILSEEVSTDLAHGTFHSVEAYVIFAIAMAMMVGLHALINLISRQVAGRKQVV
jgi:exosortase